MHYIGCYRATIHQQTVWYLYTVTWGQEVWAWFRGPKIPAHNDWRSCCNGWTHDKMTSWSILDSSEGSVQEAGGRRDAIYSLWCHVKHVLVMKSGVNNLLIHDRNIPHDLTLTSLYEHSVLFSCNRKMAFSRPLPGSGISSTGKLQGLVPWNKNAQRSNTAGNQLLRWNKATSWKVKLSGKSLGKVLLFYQKSITRQEKRRRIFLGIFAH